jgi:hypothetical protein
MKKLSVLLFITGLSIVGWSQNNKKEYHVQIDSGAIANFYGGKIYIGKLYITNTSDFELFYYQDSTVSKDSVLHTFVFKNGEKPSLGVDIQIMFNKPVLNFMEPNFGGTSQGIVFGNFDDQSGGELKISLISGSQYITIRYYTPPGAHFVINGAKISKDVKLIHF